MAGDTKYTAMGALGMLLVVIGCILLAVVTDDDDGGNTFARIFAGSLGVSLMVLGIGTAIAAAATFLARRE